MRSHLPFLALLFLLLLPRPTEASDTRVQSMGGLTLVATDESQAVHPFTIGNPAGLALLPARSRLDLAGQWFDQHVAINGNSSQIYGTLNSIGDGTMDIVKYHGLLLFPAEGLALQADGDILHTENQRTDIIREEGRDRIRGLFRAAYDFGPFILGGEILTGQADFQAEQGFQVATATVLSGEGKGSALHVTGGLLAVLPSGPSGEVFHLGGIFLNQVTPDRVEADLSLELTPGNIFNLSEKLEVDKLRAYGPEIHFTIPDSLEALLFARFSESSSSLQWESDNDALVADQPSYRLNDADQMTVAGAFKASQPLPEDLTLKDGLVVSITSSRYNLYETDGTVRSQQDGSSWEAQGGIGIEAKGGFTLGLQARIMNDQGSIEPALGAARRIAYSKYEVSIGGEKWLDGRWAYRMGLIYSNELNSGDEDYDTFFYTISDGQRLITTTATLGIGYQEDPFKADLMFWYGQPSLHDSPVTDAFASQVGIQLAASLFFDAQ